MLKTKGPTDAAFAGRRAGCRPGMAPVRGSTRAEWLWAGSVEDCRLVKLRSITPELYEPCFRGCAALSVQSSAQSRAGRQGRQEDMPWRRSGIPR
jgi:hypothetical protein